MKTEIRTVKEENSVEFVERKSRFIGHISPINDENEANGFIKRVKSKYWDATHNVFAYYLNKDNVIQRFSDDGEPSRTAGIPILDIGIGAFSEDKCFIRNAVIFPASLSCISNSITPSLIRSSKFAVLTTFNNNFVI